MPDCETYLELISASLDGVITPAETKALKAHLEVCPQCRTLLEDLTALHAAMPEEEEPPQGFSERVMAAVAAQEKVVAFPGKKNRRRWGSIAAVAAVFALVAVGYGPLSHYLDPELNSASGDQAPMAAAMDPVEASPTAALPSMAKVAGAALPTSEPETTTAEGSMDQVTDAAPDEPVGDTSAAKTAPDAAAGVIPDAWNGYGNSSYGSVSDPPQSAEPPQEAPVPRRMAMLPPLESADGTGVGADSSTSASAAPAPADVAPVPDEAVTGETAPETANELVPMPMMLSATAPTYAAALTLDALPQGWEEALTESLGEVEEETEPSFPPEGLEVSAAEAQALMTLAEDQDVPYTLEGELIEGETCLVTVAPPDAEITDPTPVLSVE